MKPIQISWSYIPSSITLKFWGLPQFMWGMPTLRGHNFSKLPLSLFSLSLPLSLSLSFSLTLSLSLAVSLSPTHTSHTHTPTPTHHIRSLSFSLTLSHSLSLFQVCFKCIVYIMNVYECNGINIFMS